MDEQWLASGKPIELTITLSGDTWVPTLGEDDFGDGPTTELISGLVASTTGLTGWNNVIVPGILPSNVERVDDVTVKLTIDQFFDFDIQASTRVTEVARALGCAPRLMCRWPSCSLLTTTASAWKPRPASPQQ